MEENRQLILRAKKGDQRALNLLFTTCYQRVYNIAYKYFSDEDTARDISQQAFITVQQKLEQLQDPESFRIWLYRIVINTCHTEARRHKVREKTLRAYRFQNFSYHSHGPEEDYQKDERSRMVHQALQQIPDEQRLVIIMKEYEGLKFREIAAILDASENTVKSRLYYGLEALRKFFLAKNMKKEVMYE